MQGLLSLLVFAAFFYLMMRFGCGAHMVHGHGGQQGDTPAEGNRRDPVCGMDVGSGEGYSKMHQGRRYRFCGRQCLDQFDADPQRYVASAGERS
jgi:YHS domain-containing protein